MNLGKTESSLYKKIMLEVTYQKHGEKKKKIQRNIEYEYRKYKQKQRKKIGLIYIGIWKKIRMKKILKRAFMQRNFIWI